MSLGSCTWWRRDDSTPHGVGNDNMYWFRLIMSSVACWFLLSTLTSQGVICPKPFLVVVVVVSFYLHQKCPKRLRLGWWTFIKCGNIAPQLLAISPNWRTVVFWGRGIMCEMRSKEELDACLYGKWWLVSALKVIFFSYVRLSCLLFLHKCRRVL